MENLQSGTALGKGILSVTVGLQESKRMIWGTVAI